MSRAAPARGRTGAPRGPVSGRLLRLCVSACLALGAAVRPVVAQDAVGHEPEHSPYRDITNHQAFTIFVGRFTGTPGPAGVGAQSATAFGARLQIRLSNPIDLWATFGEAASRRLVIDAATDTAKSLGVQRMNFLLADLGLAINLTGDKTWHALAPYVGVGLGIVRPSHVTTDPGGFQLGTAFTLMPTIGTRWFVARPFALHFEVRDVLYRIAFPLQYYNSYWIAASGAQPILSTSVPDRQWTHNFVLWVGASYTYTF